MIAILLLLDCDFASSYLLMLFLSFTCRPVFNTYSNERIHCIFNFQYTVKYIYLFYVILSNWSLKVKGTEYWNFQIERRKHSLKLKFHLLDTVIYVIRKFDRSEPQASTAYIFDWAQPHNLLIKIHVIFKWLKLKH